jgi:hypothetical protein
MGCWLGIEPYFVAKMHVEAAKRFGDDGTVMIEVVEVGVGNGVARRKAWW